MKKIVLVLIICLSLTSPSLSLHVRLRPNQIRIVQVLPNQLVQVSSDLRTFNASHAILHVNAFRPVCVGHFQTPSCPQNASQGTDVGWEVILKPPSRRDQFTSNILSKTKQSVFLSLRAYKKAAVIGACERFTEIVSTPHLNPSILVNTSRGTYDSVSFQYSSIFKPDSENSVLSCSDPALKSVITYDLYAIPWNQRYIQPNPSFDSSSLRSLQTALNESTNKGVFDKGSLLTSFQMSSSPPDLRISKRFGLDVVLTVVARWGSSEPAFYVSHLIWGCTDGNPASDRNSCVLLSSLFLKILVGCYALFGLFFSHLGRRFHRLNTFFSGYVLGCLVSYILLGRFTSLTWVVILSISLSVCGLALGLLSCAIFWRTKPNCRTSYMPLYVDVSFLIIASLFFTTIGNQPLWNEETVFIGVFFGLVAFLSVLIFPWVTELISVDLCTALLGNFLFVAGVTAIFLPGCVFPFVLWDAVNRVSQPGSHAALSIFVNSAVDFVVFAAWPLLSLLMAIFNRCCSPPLKPREEQIDTNRQNYNASETWPPLPPEAFVSERAPLLNDRRDTVAFASAPPPPYYHPSEDPPAYRP